MPEFAPEILSTQISWRLDTPQQEILDWWAWLDMQVPCEVDWKDLGVVPPPLSDMTDFNYRVQQEAVSRGTQDTSWIFPLAFIWQLRDCLSYLDKEGLVLAAWWAVLGTEPYISPEEPHYELVELGRDFMRGRITGLELSQGVVRFAMYDIPEIRHTYEPVWRQQLITKTNNPATADPERFDPQHINSLALTMIQYDARQHPAWPIEWIRLLLRHEGMLRPDASRNEFSDLERMLESLVSEIWPVPRSNIRRMDVYNPMLQRFMTWWWRHTICASAVVQEIWSPDKLIKEGYALLDRAIELLESIQGVVEVREVEYDPDDPDEILEEYDLVETTYQDMRRIREGLQRLQRLHAEGERRASWINIVNALAGHMASWPGWMSPIISAAIKADTMEGARWSEGDWWAAEVIQLEKDVQLWWSKASAQYLIKSQLERVPTPRFGDQIEHLEALLN